jgi:hypothetical protein
MSRSPVKEFIVRRRAGSFWQYATRRYEMVKLGLSGAVQTAVWSCHRKVAKRFGTRSQARKWVRSNCRYCGYVEIVSVGPGPLKNRFDDLIIQRKLFE